MKSITALFHLQLTLEREESVPRRGPTTYLGVWTELREALRMELSCSVYQGVLRARGRRFPAPGSLRKPVAMAQYVPLAARGGLDSAGLAY